MTRFLFKSKTNVEKLLNRESQFFFFISFRLICLFFIMNNNKKKYEMNKLKVCLN